MRALEREAKAQRDLFESYLAKYREASARDSIAAAPADARIISRAVVSNVPYFPKKAADRADRGARRRSVSATAFVVTSALLSGDILSPGAAADRHHSGRGGAGALGPCAHPRQRPAAGRAQFAVAADPDAGAGSGCGHRQPAGATRRRCRCGLAPGRRGRPTGRRDRQRAQRRHDADRDCARPLARANRPGRAGRSRA